MTWPSLTACGTITYIFVTEGVNDVTVDELKAVIDRLRADGAEPTRVEVKSAVGGLPANARDSLSAFRNDRGGVLILGLSEADGFLPAEGFNAPSIRDALAGMAANDMSPPVRGEIDIHTLDGSQIVVFEVDEADPIEKPVYVTAKGTYGGSFIRSGDGDRRMTDYEVSQLLSNRTQPAHDREPVTGAAMEDLDWRNCERLIVRVRDAQPRAFEGLDDMEVLRALGVIVQEHQRDVPTLAGMLTLGRFPQKFFPQLNATLVVVPGTEMGEALADGTRFLDNRSFDGPLPLIVDDLTKALSRHLARKAVVAGAGRRDPYEYPQEAVREVVTNALMHRDYSPASRGTQVQVELYADRLVVRNPGGIYGPIDVAALGAEPVSSSRNAVLARLLADVAIPGGGDLVSENRGSGIPRILRLLRDAGMSPPRFDSSAARMVVTIPRHALLDDETMAWVAGLAIRDLSDAQVMALAMIRQNGQVSNENLRGWGFDALASTRALSELVGKHVIERRGGRRYATYELASSLETGGQLLLPDSDSTYIDELGLPAGLAGVLRLALERGQVRTTDVEQEFGLPYHQALRLINRLIEQGHLIATASPTSRKRAYRFTRPN